jgi:hypothetical protein
MFKKIVLATLVAASCGTAPLIASAAQRAIVITQAPPAPREEAMPAPRRGQEWAPGHWAWRHGEHIWVTGHWMQERHGQRWVADRWVEHDGRWTLQAGHWERGMRDQARTDGRDAAQQMGNRGDMGRMHDGDGDGVPNRYDSRPNNPNKY